MLEQKVVHSPFVILFYETILPFSFCFTYESIAHTFFIRMFPWEKKKKKNYFQWSWTFNWMDVVITLKW